MLIGEVLTMAEYFAGGHLRFVDGEWRDDDGNMIEVYQVRHGSWEEADWIECSTNDLYIRTPRGARRCRECKRCFKKELLWKDNYCPNCGAKMMEG